MYDGTADEALACAKDGVDRANYSESSGTLWIGIEIRCKETGERHSDTVTIHETEPNCNDGFEHKWESPFEIVGGIKENPGVFGNGGGVIITEVCVNCGCKRTTDTWAQNPETGEQGLLSVEYEPGAFADEIGNI